MRIRPSLAAALAVLASAAAPHPASADIYTWVDASGVVTVSNLVPPEGVRVTNVQATSIEAAAAAAAARESARAAEVAELIERVRQLEREVETARSAPPPDVLYPATPPIVPQVLAAPYADAVSPPSGYVCDQSGVCWPPWAAAPIYPASVVVLGGGGKRVHHHSFRDGRRSGGHVPTRGQRTAPPRHKGR
jgi:hypothetical protein